MQTVNTDIVIIGAGIAGLWLHHRLNDMGFHAILVEKEFIGHGQTLSSQGIIHGGVKYTLNGMLSNAASAIADMPTRWLSCLDGKGDIDLSKTSLLSQHQLMWSTKSLSSKLTSFFSSKALNGKMQKLAKNDYPSFFQHPKFKGNMYQLNEPVLDVSSLMTNLAEKWQHRIVRINNDYTFVNNDQQQLTSLVDKNLTICAQEFILTSGEGTEALLQRLGNSTPKMQRRPLKMVLAKSAKLPAIYAHCVGTSTKPIATITSHVHCDGDTVWYIGGDIAENGTSLSDQALIQQTQKTLVDILPWVDLADIDWATHSVNRAEPAQKNLLRPDAAFLQSTQNLHIAWPTKLALTPNLSDQLLSTLEKKQVRPDSNIVHTQTDQQLNDLPASFKATISKSLWERTFNDTHQPT